MTVLEFLAAEETRDVLRQRRAADRQALREAISLAQKNPHNDGSSRLIAWAEERYSR